MTVDEIKELIQVVNESGIAELEVQRGDNRVRIRRATRAAAAGIRAARARPVIAPVAPHMRRSGCSRRTSQRTSMPLRTALRYRLPAEAGTVST